MKDSILLQTLAAMTSAEMQDLHTFVTSTLYNGGKHAKQITALFTLLSTRLGTQNASDLEKREVYEALFPGKPYQHGYFENLKSELMGLVRQFVAIQETRRGWGASFEWLAMARFYRARALPERSQQAFLRGKSALADTGQGLAERRLLEFWLEQEASLQACLTNKRKGDLNVPAALHALTRFYAYQFLELVTVLHQQQRVVPDLKTDWKPFIESFRETLQRRDYLGDSALRILDEALNLLHVSPELAKQVLEQFLNLFRANESSLAPSLQKILAAYARNTCVQYDTQIEAFFRFDLYREHLDKGWLYEQDNLSPSTFINLVNIGLKLGEKDWVGRFLLGHQHRIMGEHSDILFFIGTASHHFETGAWNEVDTAIREARKLPKPSDIGIEKVMRILEIKICYERSPDSNQMDDLLNSFVMFIRRNKQAIVQAHREMDINFASVVRQLTQLGQNKWINKSHAGKLHKLSTQIRDDSFRVAERLWLQKKTDYILTHPPQA